MARKICVQEITDLNKTHSMTVVCTSPAHTPVGQGDVSECNCLLRNVAFTVNPVPTISFSYDVQFKYSYNYEGGTFEEFCSVMDQSGALTFNSGVGTCDCADAFTMTHAMTSDPAAITWTQSPNTVLGPVTFSFTLQNLCAQTIICVEEGTCP
ncbi:hypothetical protein Dred_1403 [Desulforamulus reducens MI-1]|uniref:Uncharacterized protein n=1 Tax=Desulforamulus reducens (strain ATCC BAA-1160 / DSM 100696 / MI-1) TaxID=349161 RepID=A4J4D0_DESRM|nr:hypothetical protein [Desulforamulus reducens]ABO49933.1 hypothetical protein Dred_1403 [Desulforamulus reducens MI-1]